MLKKEKLFVSVLFQSWDTYELRKVDTFRYLPFFSMDQSKLFAICFFFRWTSRNFLLFAFFFRWAIRNFLLFAFFFSDGPVNRKLRSVVKPNRITNTVARVRPVLSFRGIYLKDGSF